MQWRRESELSNLQIFSIILSVYCVLELLKIIIIYFSEHSRKDKEQAQDTFSLSVITNHGIMASKKKAKQQARNARREFEQCGNRSSNLCRHFYQGDVRHKDVDTAYNLIGKYQTRYNATVHEGLRGIYLIYPIACHVHEAYDQFNDNAKKMFRRMVLASGIKECFDQSRRKDLTKKDCIGATRAWILMFLLIELRERKNGIIDEDEEDEIHKSLIDIADCTRETVRYFHRRNPFCDCLKELYYKLKESTKRTAACWYCGKIVEIKNMQRCECELPQYCSYECAMAMWPHHKENCKRRRENNLRKCMDKRK